MTSAKDPVQILKEALSERMGANPRYSLRAFARDLKISPQQLSNVMNGRKGLSSKSATQVARTLGLSETEKEYFYSLVQSVFGRSQSQKKIAQAKVASLQSESKLSTNLGAAVFRVISDWYHFALIELLKLPESKGITEGKIVSKLGIPLAEVKMAISRLKQLKLITESKTKGWIVNEETLMTTDGIPSEALRKFHRQVLEKAIDAIPTQSIDERYISTSMITVKKSDFKKAEKLIRQFRENFSASISTTAGDEVYSLGIQYFRLTHKESIQET